MKNHVTSLSLSRELWEAGLRVESHFVWVDKFPIFNDTDRLATREDLQYRLDNCILSEEAKKLIKFYPALLASELGELLPEMIHSGKTYNGDWWLCTIDDKSPIASKLPRIEGLVDGEKMSFRLKSTGASSECDARAKMLLYLIREGLVDVKSLNREVQI